ncbi:hypothetical protein EDB84DRAFT_1518624, partial [Lactarius hengduanensis]
SLSPCCSVFTLTICHSFCTLLPLITGSLRICVNPFVFKTHSRSLIDGTRLPLFPPVRLGSQAQRPLLHFSLYRLSGSLFGFLGFIGFTSP